jgi:hypothetical protein
MEIKYLLLFISVISLLFFAHPSPLFAHPGNTDSAGCHTCRTNCTERWGIPYGFYHTHYPVRACGAPPTTNVVTPTPRPSPKTIKPSPTPTPTPTPSPTNTPIFTPSPSPEVKGETTQGGSVLNWIAGAGIGSYALWKFIKWIDSKAPDL